MCVGSFSGGGGVTIGVLAPWCKTGAGARYQGGGGGYPDFLHTLSWSFGYG